MLGPVFLQMQIGASGPPGPADADDARPCVSGAPGPADADDARPCVLQIGAEAVLMLMMLGPVFLQMQIGAQAHQALLMLMMLGLVFCR